MADEITNKEIDLNGDGKVTDKELNMVETRFKNRRKMAWFALFAMIGFTALLLTPAISNEKITALNNVLSSFYFAMASVIGAYMGFTTWASRP